ncbi:MAG: flagellar motor protein MotA, partial [Xanthobacteraceae bacterium]
QAQNRFYTELEDWLSTAVYDHGAEPAAAAAAGAGEMRNAIERLRAAVNEAGGNKTTTTAVSNLAEAIQGLVNQMRAEQQTIRDWVESQAEQQAGQHREIKRLLEMIVREDVNS